MEYDRNQNDYSAASPTGDRYYFEAPSAAYPNGRLVSVDDPTAQLPGLSATNKAEVDCLLCHMNGSKNGIAWLNSKNCSTTGIGPLTDPYCQGEAAPYTPGTAYDMYNRNFAIKSGRFDLAASLGIGAKAVLDANGNAIGVTGMPSVITADKIVGTPNSQNCSVCHARDENTVGLPGMMQMKFGYGNYAILNPAGTAFDTQTGSMNDKRWLELGCKTGMGKRAHRIGQGPNDKWGMSMFNAMFGLGKNPGDPVVTEELTSPTLQWMLGPNAKVVTKERMPDTDVHEMGKNANSVIHQCATCHSAIGSTELEGGSRDIPATTHNGIAYPAETVFGIDHQFLQSDSAPDTKGKNNLDGTVSCESCHTHRDHPRIGKIVKDKNGNDVVYNPPTPTHANFPAFHIEKIGCSTCHIPEIYAAPGKLKYRDWTVGFYKGNARNMLDWNYDLITGSHKPSPVLRKWMTKEGEKKIYPINPAVLPIFVKSIDVATVNGVADTTGSELALDPADSAYPTGTLVAPVKHRDTALAARQLLSQGAIDVRLNAGNMVPLFDGFALADSFAIDTKAEIDAMTSPSLIVDGSRHANKLRLFWADFDVTHGVAPKEWALGGSKRGGCVSCHSSIDPFARNQYGQPTGPNPNYSSKSIGFFESYQQPLESTGFGIGQYDAIKNWFALFADYDCTMMCGGGTQPDSTYFDQAGNPIMTAACGDPFGMGWTQLQHCVNFMTSTFDTAMGFPQGTAMLMGMYDGISGLQGFTIRETVSGSTLGCNPFAGAESMSPFPGYSVNACMPSNNPMFTMGTCVGANPSMGMPGQCDSNSFRANGMCMVDSDCNGKPWPAEEYAANPNGLLYQRAEVRKHFKIMLQQSTFTNPQGQLDYKVTWPISIEQNPGNPNHVASWDQAKKCVDMMGMPKASCADGDLIKTTLNANDFLGYDPTYMASLITPEAAGISKPVAVNNWSADAVVDYKVNFDGSGSTCQGGCSYAWDFN
ncbi:MAG: hypothetical protein AB1553_13510, partial [Nitrospirota bacterium]